MDAGRGKQALLLADQLCKRHDARLLYLAVFGSRLYGTSTGNSDLDMRGLFLPSLASIVTGEARNRLHFSTGDPGAKNTASDLDLDLHSLNHWLLKLLPDGEIDALDLLFSPSNESCVLMQSDHILEIFRHPEKFLNFAHARKYAEYCFAQTKKYGIRGSRLGSLRSVWHWLQKNDAQGRLIDHLDELAQECGHGKYCHNVNLPDGPALLLCGKIHNGTIQMEEFRERLDREMENSGARAIAAEADQGLDFKALSHAMRALNQMEEVLLTGKIHFPLKSRDELVEIKTGKIPWLLFEQQLLDRLDEIDKLYTLHAQGFTYDWKFAKQFLLSCYGLSLTPLFPGVKATDMDTYASITE